MSSCGQTATNSAPPAAERSFSECIPQATPTTTDPAFSRVLHVASGVGHKHEVLRQRAARLISFTIGRRTVAAYEVGLIGQKPPDDCALVWLHFATKNMRRKQWATFAPVSRRLIVAVEFEETTAREQFAASVRTTSTIPGTKFGW